MTAPVPRLVPPTVSPALRLAGRLARGIRQVTDQIAPYTKWWDEQNEREARADGPLVAVVGDSTAIGIGASAPDRGYVWRLRADLRHHDGRPWRVVNLARSGARVRHALDDQLPYLDRLRPEIVICCIGTNDVIWDWHRRVGPDLRRLVAILPTGTHVATVPGGSLRARAANRTVTATAGPRGHHVVDPWREPGPRQRLAADRFHPNDIGYDLIARAFARSLGLADDGVAPARPQRGLAENRRFPDGDN